MTELALMEPESPVTGQPTAAEGDLKSVPTTLGDLIAALQEATPDDSLVLAAVSDLMDHGRLKRRIVH
jgi:hypothetical protein